MGLMNLLRVRGRMWPLKHPTRIVLKGQCFPCHCFLEVRTILEENANFFKVIGQTVFYYKLYFYYNLYSEPQS